MARNRPDPQPSPSLLYGLGVGLGVLLLIVGLLAPLADAGANPPEGFGQVIALFARDVPLRKTTIASGLGLAVTAAIFFRPPKRRPPAEKSSRSQSPPPANVVGA